jgi:hypothetical protein
MEEFGGYGVREAGVNPAATTLGFRQPTGVGWGIVRSFPDPDGRFSFFERYCTVPVPHTDCTPKFTSIDLSTLVDIL